MLPPTPAPAQNTPRLGYVYPAGGRQGTTFQILVGGQYLGSVSNAVISGDGARAKVIEFNRPLSQKDFNESRDKLKELQEKRQANRKTPDPTNTWTAADEQLVEEIKAKVLKNPPNRQGNPAIAETVTIEVTLATNAAPGEREIRLATPNGLSNPLVFCVGQFPESAEAAGRTLTPDIERFLEKLGRKPVPAKSESHLAALPATVNGQILPGAVDRHRFFARAGQRLVVAVSARSLIPYIPDAVPGWFQATLSLHDAKGRELAYTDDFRFSPDPVLVYDIARDGEYVIEIKDSIYRGREDFVYRIVIGELPFVTSAFPLGGRAGERVTVEMKGWNLAPSNLTQVVQFAEPGIYQLSTTQGERVSNLVPFAVDTLPEEREQEPNDSPSAARLVTLPLIVNGRIDRPGDADVFCFEGAAGSEIVAEVTARRLHSPLDSALRLTDSAGRQIAFNDDTEDKGAGLETHHADSYLRVTLPTNGLFHVQLRDTQGQGGPEYSYRLRLSAPRPDFALRLVPASLSVRPGASAPLTVYALRQDGFTNAITLELKTAPAGFKLSGAQVPAGQDKVKLTVAAPATAPTSEDEDCPVKGLQLQGRAIIDGRAVIRPAVPAEDMMQAFIYRHLVPARELDVIVAGRSMPQLKILSASPVKIPAGGTARVRVGPAGPKFAENFQLELSDPPEGITLKGITTVRDGAEIEFEADAKVAAGLKGNLNVSAFADRPQAGAKGQKRRNKAGSLPAIPFEIAAPP